MDRDDVYLILVNRSFVYALLARTFAEEPDRRFIDIVNAEHTAEELLLIEDECSAPIQRAYEEALKSLRSSASMTAGADAQDLLTSLRSEYVRIFIGPQTPLASPWECMHTTGKRMLLQPGVLDIRQAYRDAGYLPALYPHVSDDFIGLEMDFMAKLATEAAEAYEAGCFTSCRDRLEHANRFLLQHII